MSALRSMHIFFLLLLVALGTVGASELPDEDSRQKVLGIGGLFFRSGDPERLAQWYEKHLGVSPVPKNYEQRPWYQESGPTVFAPFPRDSAYFGKPERGWMINFRVADLAAMVGQLRANGVAVEEPKRYPNGYFARLYDPEGNPIELWQPSPEVKAQTVARWMQSIATADYEGNRAELDRLYVEAGAFLDDQSMESRIRYWKGFAKWRRAINGANETPTPTDLITDVDLALIEFRRSGELDPAFVDARIGEVACMGLAFFFDRTRSADQAFVDRYRALLLSLKEDAAENPRYVWVWGMAFFNQPPERGGGPDNVIAAYKKALRKIRSGAKAAGSPLDPVWGEAELNVNLAYSYLSKRSPDPALAMKYVDEAIRLAPNWHYARNILRPQIEEAARSAGKRK